MSQQDEKNYATLMVKVYDWLTEYQSQPSGSWFVYRTASKGDRIFAGRGTKDKPQNEFRVMCVLQQPNTHSGASIRFKVSDDFEKIDEIAFKVAWAGANGGKIDDYVDLAKSLGHDASGKQEGRVTFATGLSKKSDEEIKQVCTDG